MKEPQQQSAEKKRREDSPLSPKQRRSAEKTLRQLQSDVMSRARSTLNIIDVWKSKIVPSSSPGVAAAASPGGGSTALGKEKGNAGPPVSSAENRNVAKPTAKNGLELFSCTKNKSSKKVTNQNDNTAGGGAVAGTSSQATDSIKSGKKEKRPVLSRIKSLELKPSGILESPPVPQPLSDSDLEISLSMDNILIMSNRDNPHTLDALDVVSSQLNRNRPKSVMENRPFSEGGINRGRESVMRARLKLDDPIKMDFDSTKNELGHTLIEEYEEDGLEDYTSDDSVLSYLFKPGKKLTFQEPNRRNYDIFRHRSGSLDSDLESQAMRIVRTVGQAFEVCHKISVQKNSMENGEDCSETPCDTSEQDRFSEAISLGDEEDIENIPRKDLATPDFNNKLNRPDQLDILKSANIPKLRKLTSLQEKDDKSDNNQINKQQDDLGLLATTPISGGEDVVTLRKQLEQQTLQTRQAMAQLMMVREQLISETNARLEAQARTQQLLQQNRELLEHIVSLGGYNEPDRPNLTATAISLAPQTPLTHLLINDQQQQQHHQQQLTEAGSPLRKSFPGSPFPSSNQAKNFPLNFNAQMPNLNTINQQLNTLTQQLSGLNQQTQNLQNLQQAGGHLAVPVLPKLNPELMTQQDLLQLNQELLNRLQQLNFGQAPNVQCNNPNSTSPSSFVFMNPMNGNRNSALLGDGMDRMDSLTPSPRSGTLNRHHSYSSSPIIDPKDNSSSFDSFQLQLNKFGSNMSDINAVPSDNSGLIRPLSQVGTMTTLDPTGQVKVIVPVQTPQLSTRSATLSPGANTVSTTGGLSPTSCHDFHLTPVLKRSDKKVTLNSKSGDGGHKSAKSGTWSGEATGGGGGAIAKGNMVTLKITDEAGNSRAAPKKQSISATPSFITRSTSEKVPNRSQMMQQVQRTTWARHTTK